MEVTLRTPALVGHILKEEHHPSVVPTFTGRVALCGAAVRGPVRYRRYVCGKCVTLVIAERNALNTQLDVADARAAIRDDTIDALLGRLSPSMADDPDERDYNEGAKNGGSLADYEGLVEDPPSGGYAPPPGTNESEVGLSAALNKEEKP